MGISEENDVLYATVSKDLKGWLEEKARCEKRSLSAQVAYMLERQRKAESNGSTPREKERA